MSLTAPEAVRKIENDLAYRLPTSNKPLSVIVVQRADAEALLRELRVHHPEWFTNGGTLVR